MKRKPEERPADETDDDAPEGAEPVDPALTAANELAQQLKSKNLELAADLDNQAKRFARERQVVREEITTRFAREMIEVLDNLDSVVRSMTEEERASPLGKGVALTQVVFLEKLKSFGVERIEAEGRPFDPAWHEAMRETPSADVAPGTVLAEWTRGYRLGGKLVRAAKVEVAKAAEDDAAADGS